MRHISKTSLDRFTATPVCSDPAPDAPDDTHAPGGWWILPGAVLGCVFWAVVLF